jgi:Arc-like DNA binding domain
MARKLTEIVALSLRIREEMRRRLEREAKKQERSLNAEIVNRLEQSIQAQDAADRDAGTEKAFLDHYSEGMEPSQVLEILAYGLGPYGRLAAMAAVRTEQGRAAALEALQVLRSGGTAGEALRVQQLASRAESAR